MHQKTKTKKRQPPLLTLLFFRFQLFSKKTTKKQRLRLLLQQRRRVHPRCPARVRLLPVRQHGRRRVRRRRRRGRPGPDDVCFVLVWRRLLRKRLPFRADGGEQATALATAAATAGGADEGLAYRGRGLSSDASLGCCLKKKKERTTCKLETNEEKKKKTFNFHFFFFFCYTYSILPYAHLLDSSSLSTGAYHSGFFSFELSL